MVFGGAVLDNGFGLNSGSVYRSFGVKFSPCFCHFLHPK